MEQRGIRRQERFITTLIGNDGVAELGGMADGVVNAP